MELNEGRRVFRHKPGVDAPVGFVDASHVIVYDSDGKEVTCKCGNPDATILIGRDRCGIVCYKCMFGESDGMDQS